MVPSPSKEQLIRKSFTKIFLVNFTFANHYIFILSKIFSQQFRENIQVNISTKYSGIILSECLCYSDCTFTPNAFEVWASGLHIKSMERHAGACQGVQRDVRSRFPLQNRFSASFACQNRANDVFDARQKICASFYVHSRVTGVIAKLKNNFCVNSRHQPIRSLVTGCCD